MKALRHLVFALVYLGVVTTCDAQFSPGKLSTAHAHLEGMNHCTSCHDVGAKISVKKCLDCHKEINTLIVNKRGYHASVEVQNKSCIKCHSEHHGRDFDATKFDQKNFKHDVTGYQLKGKHNTIDCKSCHKPDNIPNPDIKKRQGTFLGLEHDCIACHSDYHQGTIKQKCTDCHGFDKFTNITSFSHNKTKFPLTGAHLKVSCAKCHKETTRNGKAFRQFTGIPYSKCTDCHVDKHNNQFGPNCTNCHSIFSWTQMKSDNRFNHNLTKFPLLGQHMYLDCKKCHKQGKYTTPINHSQCNDCHDDYHQGNFKEQSGAITDCKKCHSVEKPFSFSSFGIDEHQTTDFVLDGGHLATPCTACHKKSNDTRWNFRFASKDCITCHQDSHEGKISQKYYDEQSCKNCHNTGSWNSVIFDHNKTNWPLEGRHTTLSCRHCHFKADTTSAGTYVQVFNGMSTQCAGCHQNVHGSQFEVAGVTDCRRCHTMASSWNVNNFSHDRTAFPLTGKHKDVACVKCHKPVQTEPGMTIVEYKIKSYRCIDCHSS